MVKIIPTVMVKNESRFIAAVLRPLVAVFGCVVMGDTGSTDGTEQIGKSIPGVKVVQYGPQDVWGLSTVRAMLGGEAHRMGATHQIQVDGDELYTVESLAFIRDYGFPDGRDCGFVTMQTLDVDENNDLWELNDLSSRFAVFPALSPWVHIDYPFDAPLAFEWVERHFYYPNPPGYDFSVAHLHRLERSGSDDHVTLRLEKKHRFSLMEKDLPRTRPFDLQAWLSK